MTRCLCSMLSVALLAHYVTCCLYAALSVQTILSVLLGGGGVDLYMSVINDSLSMYMSSL